MGSEHSNNDDNEPNINDENKDDIEPNTPSDEPEIIGTDIVYDNDTNINGTETPLVLEKNKTVVVKKSINDDEHESSIMDNIDLKSDTGSDTYDSPNDANVPVIKNESSNDNPNQNTNENANNNSINIPIETTNNNINNDNNTIPPTNIEENTNNNDIPTNINPPESTQKQDKMNINILDENNNETNEDPLYRKRESFKGFQAIRVNHNSVIIDLDHLAMDDDNDKSNELETIPSYNDESGLNNSTPNNTDINNDTNNDDIIFDVNNIDNNSDNDNGNETSVNTVVEFDQQPTY
eukprot:CAMPEP_0114673486 /NCGR_PEP_ID=MMETSP0191-20121206/44766_1 /TAXON_ID=126664 /ORGANISM="Sorites sp." /LENGTH=293 /DNA_ID=CAMNT_0001938497 /DNA_START=613 /DNA_END=1494 /DNA_ORIENTATION=+